MRGPLLRSARHAAPQTLMGLLLLAASFLGTVSPAGAEDPPTWVPPALYKYADPDQVKPGYTFDFVASVINDPLNQAVWSAVTVTDVLDPLFEIEGVDVEPYADEVTIVGQTVTVVLDSLQPQSYLAIYIHCRLDTSTEPGLVIDNTAVLVYEDPDGNLRGPVSYEASIVVVPNALYVPLVLQQWPPFPHVPELYAIANPSGLGTYNVSWGSAAYADLYILQEAKNSVFSSPVVVYEGPQTSYQASGRGASTYYYRVKGRNEWGDSAWSNVQSTDVVWEAEPNDDAMTQANGPVRSGLTYHGTIPNPADKQDYYYLELSVAGSIEITLSNIAAGNNLDLVLRDSSLYLVGYSGNFGNSDEHIFVSNVAPGKYYIQVYNRSGPGSSQAYNLSVTY